MKADINEDRVIRKLGKYIKLFDRFAAVGKYILDISVQRYIIEHDLKAHGVKKNVNYTYSSRIGLSAYGANNCSGNAVAEINTA